ncbi:hypothetical protein EVAR_33084_1 [Eumeta japonica]|uniref:Uncharacterized protein n=1 Tax=Eumeta variegata TaxID=151549 RepID=A0A4C2A6K0_EUMVA|nr:hypothetical protein EVAR_33084_1 [Eumeta japonica]
MLSTTSRPLVPDRHRYFLPAAPLAWTTNEFFHLLWTDCAINYKPDLSLAFNSNPGPALDHDSGLYFDSGSVQNIHKIKTFLITLLGINLAPHITKGDALAPNDCRRVWLLSTDRPQRVRATSIALVTSHRRYLSTESWHHGVHHLQLSTKLVEVDLRMRGVTHDVASPLGSVACYRLDVFRSF